MESKEPFKKDPPVYERSIMLTRFKLSQQKRQLREKDNQELTQTSKKSPKSSKKQKQSPIKNKEKSQLNSGKNEFHPNKLKRNKIVNKIVLKPKNDLKVINWDGVKRKTYQTDIKSLNKKRKKSHKSSDSNEDISSPDYSELDIHEVIRMADQDLDDEDFMEILTCPSPVWWEDPPDDEHMEGPIVIRTNTLASMPDLAPEYRRKQARKRTPHKITIEQCHNEIKTNPLQSNVINSKKSDIKFTNKRNKLENLLNTMKSKRKDSSKEINIEKGDSIESKVEVFAEDSTYLDISLFDTDILKHLENIKIPIKDIEEKNEKITNLQNEKIYKNRVFYTKKSKKLQKNNSKLKIIDVKKLSNDIKSLERIKNTKVQISREKKTKKDKINKNEEKNLKKSLKIANNEIDNDSSNYLPNIKDEVNTDDNEEYITVFEIINSDDETIKNTETIKNDIKNDIKTETSSIDELNSYYKKCKKTKKFLNCDVKNKKKCVDCNLDMKNSILVPSTNDIKYCLKCSSIFDADLCNYCIKKEEKQIEST